MSLPTKKITTDKVYQYKENVLKTDTYKVIQKIIDSLGTNICFESREFDDRFNYRIEGSKKLKSFTISKLNPKTNSVIYSVPFVNAKNLFDLIWNNSIINITPLIRDKVQLRFVKSFFKSFIKVDNNKNTNEMLNFNRWDIPFLTASFVHDTYSDIGYLSLVIKEKEFEVSKIEIRGLGLSKDKKYELFKISFPQEMSSNKNFLQDFEFFIKDIADIFNQNRLGYKLMFDTVVKDSALTPYGVLRSDKRISLSDMEVAFYSLKEINYNLKDYWMSNIRKFK